jgi:L-threonylcarbamoyladenylate synthase
MKTLTVSQAAEKIRKGEVVAFPTETVYGLGADATNDEAVARIFELKERPTFNPLIVHYADLASAQTGVEFNDMARALAEAFWPGPLTLVLPRKISAGISLLASAGLDTIGVRVPNHELALKLLTKAGCPVAAPSANRSGLISPTCPAHVFKSFGEAVPILEGGSCLVGVESTIVDVTESVPVLLRPGGISVEQLTRLVGPLAQRAQSDEINAPGQMTSHYAPGIPVRLKATYVRPHEAFLGFGNCEYENGATLLNLSPRGDLVEAAANLFAMLHELDNSIYEGIAVAPIPEQGLGLAINDRLARASHERPLR